MRSLADTISRLSQMKTASPGATGDATTLAPFDRFGGNPGALKAWCHVPARLAPGAPLVVVLHGCTQTAAGYDAGAGWSRLADRHGFALLFPEQVRQNNPNLCFNWFLPEDQARGRGEAASIAAMVGAMVDRHGLDSARVFVTGLSAGGAMAAVMLATYPELFAGGAIIAGLPYGSARTIPEAFDRMRGHGGPGAVELTAAIRGASDHDGPWPTLSVWQGTADATVNPANADAIVVQWRGVHGLGDRPSLTETVDGQMRRTWCDADGREIIERYDVKGLGHGTPLAAGGADGCGRAGPYMLEAGISSTRRICAFWDLMDRSAEGVMPTAGVQAPVPTLGTTNGGESKPAFLHRVDAPKPTDPRGRLDPGRVIEDALRAAGLMR